MTKQLLTPSEIKRIRKSLNLTQETFAREIGTIGMTVSRWERGVNRPLPVYMQKLAEINHE